jgi:hypothetical protein
MSEADFEHLATIDWTRGKWSSAKGKYSREHTWLLASGAKLKATDVGALLPDGYRDKAGFNPEVTTHAFPRTADLKEPTGWRRGDYIRG